MALTRVNGEVEAGNGLGTQTHIVSIDDASAVDAEAIVTEATTGDANDVAFTVAAIEGVATGDHIALQGTAVPSLTGATVVASFV